MTTPLPRRGPPRRGTVLDDYNEQLAPRGLQLHPTKGYRKVSYRRLVAAVITEEMKQGRGSRMAIWKTAQALKKAKAAE